jgi:hypothetical protein
METNFCQFINLYSFHSCHTLLLKFTLWIEEGEMLLYKLHSHCLLCWLHLTFVIICCSSMLPYLFLLELQLGMYWTSLVGEDVKLAGVLNTGSTFFLPNSFLPWLPICLSNMCLVFDQTHFGACLTPYGSFSNCPETFGSMLWTFGPMRDTGQSFVSKLS